VYGSSFTEKRRTLIHVECPICQRSDKFSVLKTSGWCVCYRGSCDFKKRPFWEWMSLTANIAIADAKKEFFGHEMRTTLDPLNINLDAPMEDDLEPVEYPTKSILLINEFSLDALVYLQKRGLNLAMAQFYKLGYDFSKRRVYFPVFMDGKCYGYQGRAIDNVHPSMRMLNNESFSRESLVMFYEQVQPDSHVILAEGPVDALKLAVNGNSVATMGKVVTDTQLEFIMEKRPSSIYLALDDDAQTETNELIEKIFIPVYKMNVPDSAIQRCQAIGKKADFGECTFQEARQAFLDAELVDKNKLYISLI